MKSNPEFYMDWIIPKLFTFFQERGWGRPELPLYLKDEVENRFPLLLGQVVESSASLSLERSTSAEDSGMP